MPKAKRDNEFEVEKIIAERQVKGSVRYLVRWKNYGDEECTWEPRESFNGVKPINTWNKQKARGNVMNAADLKHLQKRIDAFQAGTTVDSVKEEPNPTAGKEITVYVNTPARTTSLSTLSSRSARLDSPLSRSATMAKAEIKKGGQHNRGVLKARKEHSPLTSRFNLLPNLDGTGFRSSSHQDKFQKKVREAAHASSTPTRMDGGSGSWMSFSESSNSTSPQKMLRRGNGFNQATETSSLAIVQASKDSALKESSQSEQEPPHSPSNDVSHQQDSNTCNARIVGEDEILVYLSAGMTLGDVKLVGIPRFPFGDRLLALMNDGSGVNISLRQDNILSRPEFDLRFPTTTTEFHRVGVVQPFIDTADLVNEYSQYLRNYDFAALWPVPKHEDISLLLVSSQAFSWQDFNHNQSELDQSLCQLSVAVVQNPSVPQRSDVTYSFVRSIADECSTPDHDAGPAIICEPNIATCSAEYNQGKADIKAIDPKLGCKAQHTTYSTGSKVVSSIDEMSDYGQYLEQFAKQSSRPILGLRIDDLCAVHMSNENIGTKPINIFVAFTGSHPLEAALLRHWLEENARDSQLYDNSKPEQWDDFRLRAKTDASVVLFHSERRNYHSFAGLGELMNVDHVQCYSLTFGNFVPNTLTPVSNLRLFPRGTVFLFTEENMVTEPRLGLSILKFFDDHKNPGWKLITRPAVRRWLKSVAAAEQDEDHRNAFFKC